MKLFKLFIGLTILLISVSFISCEDDITEGYLSTDLRYETNPFVLNQGEIKASPPLSVYSSTPQIHVKLLDIRNVATGKRAEDFFKTYPTPLWQGSYNEKVDTTLAILMKNRIKIEDYPVLSVEDIGGRVMITGETWNIEPGEYTMDIEVTNSAGSQIVKDALKIILNPGVDYNLSYQESFFNLKDQPAGWIWRPIEVQVDYDPDGANRVIMQWMDKNGVFFNPKNGEVIDGWTENWRHHFQENTPWGYEKTDTAMIFEFPFPPFPTRPEYWVYTYRIPARFIKSWPEEAFKDMDFDTRLHNIRLFRPGTYTFTIKSNDIEREIP